MVHYWFVLPINEICNNKIFCFVLNEDEINMIDSLPAEGKMSDYLIIVFRPKPTMILCNTEKKLYSFRSKDIQFSLILILNIPRQPLFKLLYA